MSKAFASDDSENEDDGFITTPPLPPGVRNYMTLEGHTKLKAEHEQLLAEKARLTEDSMENKKRRRKIEQRLEFIAGRLNSAQLVDPTGQDKNQVLFGATVDLADAKGEMQTWRIVGIDEMDLDKGWISWMSPLARALLEKKVGDTVTLGDQRLTLQKISY